MKTLAPIIDSSYRTERTYPELVRVKRTFVDRGVTIEIEGWRVDVEEQERLLRAEKSGGAS